MLLPRMIIEVHAPFLRLAMPLMTSHVHHDTRPAIYDCHCQSVFLVFTFFSLSEMQMSERLSLELVSLVTPTDFLVLCNPLLCRATQEWNDILMHRNSETCFSSFAASTFLRWKRQRGRGEERREEGRRRKRKRVNVWTQVAMKILTCPV